MGERDDLVVLWLWSRRLGVFSHSTALSLHELSELLPDRVHLTLPLSEERRQRQTPAGLTVHYADLQEGDRRWFECVPVTTPGPSPNSRSKDLYDIALVSMSEPVESSRLRAAFVQTVKARDTHPLPKILPPPPAFWSSSYAADRVGFDLPWGTRHACHQRAADFMAPVLAGVEGSVWEPNLGQWTPSHASGVGISSQDSSTDGG